VAAGAGVAGHIVQYEQSRRRGMRQVFHRLDLGITTCYLLECSRGYLLVDTAYARDYGRFAKAIGGLGVRLSQIRYLLLTHHHDDHAGFAAHLVGRTGCKVIVHESATPPLSEGESEHTMQPLNRCVRAVFALYGLVHREHTYPPLAVTGKDIVLTGDDFDLLHSIGIDGEILHTPGHSRDSISVVLPDGDAFVGDAAMNFLRFCGTGHRPIWVEDMDAVYDSWRKLAAHGARRIHPAHGRPFAAEELILSRGSPAGR
jgi:hydroxyacylglutathione hydrolase